MSKGNGHDNGMRQIGVEDLESVLDVLHKLKLPFSYDELHPIITRLTAAKTAPAVPYATRNMTDRTVPDTMPVAVDVGD